MNIENTGLFEDEITNLKFTRKKQVNNDKFSKTHHDENYFLFPSIEVILNDPSIHELDIKHITLKCLDNDAEKLDIMSKKIIEKFKNFVILQDTDTHVYDIGKEYIRCCLPTVWKGSNNFHNKYTIYHYNCDFYLNNEKIKFNSNSINDLKKYHIDKIIIEIKNIWKSNERYGFNNVVKSLFLTSS